jgi:hypothetical protein
MAITTCPNCEARTLPGDVSCRKCKYDFISGRQLTGTSEGAARRRALAVGGTAAGVVLVLVAIFASFYIASVGTPEALRDDDHPCLDSLRVMQPRVLASRARGNPIPMCRTGTSPTDCWAEADITAAMVSAIVEGLEMRLEETTDGFELRCRADLDGDGDRALYEANERTAGVRITASGVR